MKKLSIAVATALLGSLVLACSSSTSSDGNGNGNGNGAREFVSGNLAPGVSFTHVFNNAGSIPYFCLYHVAMGMTGAITVSAPGAPTTIPVSIFNSTLPDLAINEGDTVVWTNNTSIDHTVESDN